MTKVKNSYRGASRTPQGRHALLAKAAKALEPPSDLEFSDPEERSYYCKLLQYRAPDDWIGADFDRLKRASSLWWDIQINESLLGEELYILENDKGTPFANPRVALIDRLQGRHDAILRGLQIARPGIDPEVVAKRRRNAQAAEAALPDDPLLARPGGARPNVIPIKGAGR